MFWQMFIKARKKKKKKKKRLARLLVVGLFSYGPTTRARRTRRYAKMAAWMRGTWDETRKNASLTLAQRDTLLTDSRKTDCKWSRSLQTRYTRKTNSKTVVSRG